MKIRLTKLAESDLQSVEEYIRQENPRLRFVPCFGFWRQWRVYLNIRTWADLGGFQALASLL